MRDGMNASRDSKEVVTLWDQRRGYFYMSRIAETFLFQPVDSDNQPNAIPELADADDHELAEDSPRW
jgi:hypothetical protein